MPKDKAHPNDRVRARPTPAAPSTIVGAAPDAAISAPIPASPVAGMRLSSLASLGALRDRLKSDATAREQAHRHAEREQRAAQAAATEFRREIGDITPLKPSGRAPLPRVQPPPVPLQTQRDEQAVLDEALSDEFDPETLLDVDESLSYCRPGVAADVVRKLRSGAWVVQAQIDLHGLRRDEAREALADFLRASLKRGLRCVRVIHGKGLGSIGKEPVLKGKVRSWLAQKAEVIAFCQTRAHDGGAGAVLVLLQPEPRD
ncbi:MULTISPECIES: Smr/MutS family protein [Burkholderiaceae]|uniref:Smr/MutS family protein n=1 Tax=Burkholderiaceae TaxID=119060 RepID=UPI00095DAC4A|nr:MULTISPECIES: Smr/MutS family protein [Burkholderiaceae]MCF2133073.1 Smr/MutS family protein [Mycetohabitans sp. B3]MCG1038527.1 Smr/MutS family protein [Mycetohabitans sp. B7]SIT80403.1 DNA-nicking endonuclease, Smr domain [Burkholderia sp. b14]